MSSPARCLLATFAVALLVPTTVRAQASGGSGFPPVSTDFQVLRSEVDASLRSGDFLQVFRRIDPYAKLLFSPLPGEVLTNGAGSALGLRVYLLRTLDRLPPELIRRFWLDVDATLRREWDASGSFDSPERAALRSRIVRWARGSSVYGEALREAIDVDWLEGRHTEALRYATAFLEDAAGGRVQAKDDEISRVTALAALAAHRAGDRSELAKYQTALRERLAARGPRPEGEPEPSWVPIARAAVALSPPPVLPRSSAFDSRSVSAAPPDSMAGFRLGGIIWRDRVPETSLRRFVDERLTSRDGSPAPFTDVPLPYHAARRGDLTLFQHDDRVVAFDDARGDTRWTHWLGDAHLPHSVARVPALSARRAHVVHGDRILALDLDTGSSAWEIEVTLDVGTKRLVFAPSSATAAGGEKKGPNRASNPTGADPSRGGDGTERNADARAGDAKAGAPEDAGGSEENVPVYLLGPVTVERDAIVLPANVRIGRETESFVVELSLDGSVRWQTYLGSSRNTNFLGLGASPGIPCVAGDTIFQLTQQGTLAALDRADGAILWWTRYPTLDQSGLRESLRDENRWHPGPILTTSDHELLVVSPQDSPWLLCFRASDGALEWRYARSRESSLIGHDDERCYLAGQQITAVALRGEERGLPVWTRALEDGERYPQGRAALVPQKLLVSTRDALLHVSTSDGKLIARDLWGFPGAGGNLLPLDRGLAVIHPGGFLVYNDLEEERSRIADLAVQHPHTALEKARFQLRSGALEAGLQTIADWLASGPSIPEPNSELDRLYLEVAEVLALVARSASPELRSRLLDVRPLLELRPTRKVAAAIELGQHLGSIASWERALEAYHRALEYDVPRTEYTAVGALAVPSEAYVRNRIEEIRRAHSKLAFDEVEKKARRALERAHARPGRDNPTPIAYVEVLRVWPYTRAAADAYLSLSRFYIAYENYGKAAEYLLERLEEFPDSPDAPKISLDAADLLYRSQQHAEAKELYIRLLERWPDLVVDGVQGMQPGETLGAYVRRRLLDPGLREIGPDRGNTLRFPLAMEWRSPADLEAVNRSFLVPENSPPRELEGCFFTQSNEFIQCREIETGLPRWTVPLRMIPGFILDRFVSELYFARSGERLFRGRFVDSLLVIYDPRNILAIDGNGQVRWHVPFADDKETTPGGVPRLSERIHGVSIGSEGVYVATSRDTLYHFDLAGQLTSERALGFHAARQPLVAGGGNVWVADTRRTQASQIVHGFSLSDLSPTEPLVAVEDDVAKPYQLAAPLASLPDGDLLVPYVRDGKTFLVRVDPATREIAWTFRLDDAAVVELFLFPDYPDELLITIDRANYWPGVVAVSLATGHEVWRYEKFPARRTRLTLFRHEGRVYVIHGQEQWSLVALEVSRGASRGKLQAATVWDPHEAPLGTFFGSSRERQLHFTAHGILFPDASSISYFGAADGRPVSEPTVPIRRFLADKGSYTSGVYDGRLVILTDGGDCAFGTERSGSEGAVDRSVELVRAYLDDRFSLDTIVPLALGFFRESTPEGVQSAIRLVDRALLSEEVLLDGGREVRDVLTYLLDGLKEEAMKIAPRPTVECYRTWQAPTIDGELEDTWNYATRVRLASPRFIGRIPQPGQARDWEGEEDLSAVLYTGWDEKNFYFALDVEDDALRPFDRDAENWQGDCLIIGLDPDADGGYRFGPSDQLMTLALTVPRRNKKDKDQDDDPAAQGDEDQQDEDSPEEDEKRPDGQFSVKGKEDGSGAIYEVSLPWSSFSSRFRLPGGPPPDSSFGLSLLLTDDDTGNGATKTLSINPCHLLPPSQRQIWIWKYLVPEFFPRVVLRKK